MVSLTHLQCLEAESIHILADAGLIVITAFISPLRAEREMVRRMLPEGEFLEMHVDTPLGVADPEFRIDTTTTTSEQAADLIVDALIH